MSRRKPTQTRRKVAQQQLAWALYITEGYAANMGIASGECLSQAHFRILCDAHKKAESIALELRLALHELGRGDYL